MAPVEAFQAEALNVARALGNAVKLHRAGNTRILASGWSIRGQNKCWRHPEVRVLARLEGWPHAPPFVNLRGSPKPARTSG